MHLLYLIILWSNVFSQNNDKLFLEKFKIFYKKNDTVLLNRTSGIVYQIKNGKYIRIDESYDDKIHAESLDFILNDTLYRYGGYGYYNANKNLIYFDNSTKKWDLIRYKGFEKIEDFYSVGFHFFNKRKLYVLGYNVPEGEYQNERRFDRKGFVFDFDQKKITKTFAVDPSFIFPVSYYQVDNDHLFLFYPIQRELKVLNTNTFDLSTYNLNQIESSIINSKNEDFSLIGDKLFFKIKTNDREILQYGIDIKSVLNNMSTENNLFESSFELNKYLLVILIIVFTPIIFIIRKKNEVCLVRNETIYFRKKKINLDKNESLVVQKLSQNEEVSNLRLNDIFFEQGLNSIHINRKKNICIDRINLLFYAKFNDYLILRRKSALDKRMIVFFLNPNFKTRTI